MTNFLWFTLVYGGIRGRRKKKAWFGRCFFFLSFSIRLGDVARLGLIGFGLVWFLAGFLAGAGGYYGVLFLLAYLFDYFFCFCWLRTRVIRAGQTVL